MNNRSVRPAKITSVLPNSIAAEIGFEVGDAIVSINGICPRDLIDYQFLCADEVLELEVLDTQAQRHQVELEKDYDEDLGLEFETALFDGLIQCNNRCPFCFIDQQPPGKRETLYLKDDDYRLSFLYGSYLTLTNLPQKEWDRIAQMRLSPLYVSVHATEPEIRTQLLKNSRAGQILDQLNWFQQHHLQIHAQVVVCPGINDAQHLEQTLTDLAAFHSGDIPTVASVAVVPLGLTRFRPVEDELIPVTPEKAREVIHQVQALQHQFRQQLGSTCVWLADEWFLIAGEQIPEAAYYEDYPQIGNGVGSIRQFLQAFDQAWQQFPRKSRTSPKTFTWVVGNAVQQAFQPIVEQFNQVEGLTLHFVPLASQYWGQTITVTGLLTGEDLLANLPGQFLGDAVIIPSLMLKEGMTLFLDDMSVAEVADKLQTQIIAVNGVEELIATIMQ
ncbi:MAG: TIGR03279 family radical SAM protein [Microcoleaceae cyanobacterium]